MINVNIKTKTQRMFFVIKVSFLWIFLTSLPFISLILLVTSTYAVKEFKVSKFAGSRQIWFEAEDFDERDPDSDKNKGVGYKLADAEAKLTLPKGVFGDAITDVRGGGTIWLMYKFDISKAEAKGGTWYFWGRVINPSNQSDWLWVLGDDGKEIPKVTPAFDLADDRIFEANIGPPWGWDGGSREGHNKQLRDGENVMMIWWRQSDTTDLWDVFMWTDSSGYRPTDDDYKNAKVVKGEAVEAQGKLAVYWGKMKKDR